MARTHRNAMLIQKTKDAARATQLQNRLVDHGFGKVDLSPTQVRAIDIVLKKLKPDLQAIAIGNDDSGQPLTIRWVDK